MAAGTFHSGSAKRHIVVKTNRARAWAVVGNITGLPDWVHGVKRCRFVGRARRRVGAVRVIDFDDGNTVEEHVVAWNRGESFSYVAVSGLPLRAYVATISLEDSGGGTTKIMWESYMNSKAMSEERFAGFVASMGRFYAASLENLKALLESSRGQGSVARRLPHAPRTGPRRSL